MMKSLKGFILLILFSLYASYIPAQVHYAFQSVEPVANFAWNENDI